MYACREMMGLFTEIFQALPLAHVVGGKVKKAKHQSML
jgi:hypothetical protein